MKPYLSILIFITALLGAAGSHAQHGTLAGRVTDGAGSAVPFARILLPEIQLGAIADSLGAFQIRHIPPGAYEVRISALGYAAWRETLTVSPGVSLRKEIGLQEVVSETDVVVITGTMKETFVKDAAIKVEVISARFLQLNPTNNVIEAMQTVNGVQEQINCGVCGTNDIHINGMEGPYTLVMIDGMPIVSALASVYGFNGIPTQLIKQVEIVKGPASSLYGTEAVGGVINIITKSPAEASGLSFNAFYTSHREANTDLAGTLRLGKKVAGLFSANHYRNQYRLDANDDGFTDMPLNTRLSLFNKWEVQRKNDRLFSLAARYYTEDRFGGVMEWQPEDRGSSTVYGESIRTDRVELIGNYQLPLNEEHIRLEYSFNYHTQDSYYGNTHFAADQSILFANLIWDKTLEKHDLLLGGTFRLQHYNDNTPATASADRRLIPGIFAQDEIKLGTRATLLGGLRLDHHRDHKWVFTPRLALKYKPSDWTTFRINAGKGFRVVNLFTEDHAALTGARTVIIEEALRPEQSYNVNLNLNHVFLTGEIGTGTADIDLFYTYFQNKIIPDYDVDPGLIVYRNLAEHAIVRGFSLSADQQFTFPLRLKAGMTWQDVYQLTTDGSGGQEKVLQVFAPRISGVLAASWEFARPRLALHLTGNVVGPQRLPAYEPPFERPGRSPWYGLLNLQLTLEPAKKIQIYGGVKNLLNWTQPSPLIDPENPFGENFDTAYVYGPLQPRRIYLGLRWEWE